MLFPCPKINAGFYFNRRLAAAIRDKTSTDKKSRRAQTRRLFGALKTHAFA
jgi:hypothetical protein